VPRPATAAARALVVVAKYPAVGQVKTRLAAAIGAGPACALYGAFLADLDERLSAAGYPPLWAYTPADAPFAALVAGAERCFPQVGPDLNARLRNIFSALLAAGWERVAIVSSDSPHLPLAWLDEAYRALDNHDVVLGPADDGGYSLVAMAAPHDVFDGVVMSTDRVLAQTLELAAAQGLRVHLLPSTFDVDEPSDLPRLAAALGEPALRRALPRTAAALTQLGILAATDA
jgi:rSAM/selenodomain-associated transferase 1